MRTLILLTAVACSSSSEPKESSEGETPTGTETTSVDTDTTASGTTESGTTATGDTASASTSTPTPSEAAVQGAIDLAVGGYSCDRGFSWTGHDADLTATLFVSAYTGQPNVPKSPGDTFTGPVGQSVSVALQSGTCLPIARCSDLISSDCDWVIGRIWLATAGTVTLVHGTDGVSGTITDLELTEHDESFLPMVHAPIVQMPLVELSHRDYLVDP